MAGTRDLERGCWLWNCRGDGIHKVEEEGCGELSGDPEQNKDV